MLIAKDEELQEVVAKSEEKAEKQQNRNRNRRNRNRNRRGGNKGGGGLPMAQHAVKEEARHD